MNFKLILCKYLISGFLAFLIKPTTSLEPDLAHLCRLYENSLRLVQLTPFNSIALVYLCQHPSPSSPSHPSAPQFIESPPHSPIISFAIHQPSSTLLYLTGNSKLFISRLNSNDTTPTSPLYQHLTSTINDTSLPWAEPIWEYNDLSPSQLALDWIHHLLYLIVDQSTIYVSSLFQLNRSLKLLARPSATIRKLLVCPSLSMLLWHEISWTGANTNSLQIARQDGTERRTVYTSPSYIQDVTLDQGLGQVYFVTRGYLGVLSLKEFNQAGGKGDDDEESRVQKYPIRQDIKHFAIIGSFIMKLQSRHLTLQDLRDETHSQTVDFKYAWTDSLVQREFTLLHKYTQPASDLVCPSPDSGANPCSDICLPNAYIARFTCFCYNPDDKCPEYGHHYEEGPGELVQVHSGQEGEEEEPSIAQNKVEHEINHSFAFNHEKATPSSRNVIHSDFSGDFWLQKMPEIQSSSLKPEANSSFESSTDLKIIANNSQIQESILQLNQTQIPSDQPKHSSNEEVQEGSQILSSLRYLGTRISAHFSYSESSKSRFMSRLNRWINAHQRELFIAALIGFLVVIASTIFALFFFLASFPRLNQSKATRTIKPDSRTNSSSPPEVSIASVNKLYMHQPELSQTRPKCLSTGFDPNDTLHIKPMNHWTILDTDNDNSWCKLSLTPQSSNVSSSSPSSSHEMTTFENWEYASQANDSRADSGFSNNSTAVLLSPEILQPTTLSTNPNALYL